jgi:acetyltransferase-like isoleucine patch superfamily enzyme
VAGSLISAANLARALRHPFDALKTLKAIARGQFCRRWYPLRGIRFSAGKNLRVYGRLSIRGPGRVEFGDDVTVDMLVTPWTHAEGAVISVGHRCFLNGARMGAADRISIGDDCIVAETRIMDTDFHSVGANRHDPSAPVRVLPVIVERNVWIAASAGLLPGTQIGENSVVGFGSVCTGHFPANSLIAGNPARVLREL